MVYLEDHYDGEDRIAVGTHNHLYIIQDDSLYDITPRDRYMQAPTNTEAFKTIAKELQLRTCLGGVLALLLELLNIIAPEIITYTGISPLTLTGVLAEL